MGGCGDRLAGYVLAWEALTSHQHDASSFHLRRASKTPRLAFLPYNIAPQWNALSHSTFHTPTLLVQPNIALYPCLYAPSLNLSPSADASKLAIPRYCPITKVVRCSDNWREWRAERNDLRRQVGVTVVVPYR